MQHRLSPVTSQFGNTVQCSIACHLSHHSLTIQYNAASLVTCHITVWQYSTMQHRLSPVTSQFDNTVQCSVTCHITVWQYNAILLVTCHITVWQYSTMQHHLSPVTSQFHNTMQYYLSPVTSHFDNTVLQCSIACHLSHHSFTIQYNTALLVTCHITVSQYSAMQHCLSPVISQFHNTVQYSITCHLSHHSFTIQYNAASLVTPQFHNTMQYYLSPVRSQFHNTIQCCITCHLSHHSFTIQCNAALLVTCHITVSQYNAMLHYLSPVTSQFHNTLQCSITCHLSHHSFTVQYNTVLHTTCPSQFHNMIQYDTPPVTSVSQCNTVLFVTCHITVLQLDRMQHYLSVSQSDTTQHYLNNTCHLSHQSFIIGYKLQCITCQYVTCYNNFMTWYNAVSLGTFHNSFKIGCKYIVMHLYWSHRLLNTVSYGIHCSITHHPSVSQHSFTISLVSSSSYCPLCRITLGKFSIIVHRELYPCLDTDGKQALNDS